MLGGDRLALWHSDGQRRAVDRHHALGARGAETDEGLAHEGHDAQRAVIHRAAAVEEDIEEDPSGGLLAHGDRERRAVTQKDVDVLRA